MDEALERLRTLAAEWQRCTKCDLSATRSRIVLAGGSPTADIMIVGEAPGEEEDTAGEPFVGASGVVLDTLLDQAGIQPSEVHVANTVACWPGKGNRRPSTVEVAACRPRLMSQIYIVNPLLLIASGAVAATALLGRAVAITKERGTYHDALLDGRWGTYTVPLLLTLHPAYLLRNPDSNPGGALYETIEDYKQAFLIVRRAKEVWHVT